MLVPIHYSAEPKQKPSAGGISPVEGVVSGMTGWLLSVVLSAFLRHFIGLTEHITQAT
jgi:hypothetical protein